ncbi:MAG: TerB family tellurite resistance protein [Gammaproteobacteria bacterium]|nr:TerB family tellurite resistance protein [Gammaproteobacteria bacterium]
MRAQLKSLLARLTGSEAESDEADPTADVRYATAVLLFEVARMDQSVEPAERSLITRLLKEEYGLDESALEALLADAEQDAKTATSYHPFTRALASRLSMPQRVGVVEQMWTIALADGELDVHEEHLIRKVAGLLYVPHKAFIAAKLRVTDA